MASTQEPTSTNEPVVAPSPSPEQESFQERVQPWMLECFGAEIASDKEERNHRFLEEALELVQACGATRSEAHQLVDYTFDRPTGAAQQEVGGVMVTLAALCLAQGFDMHACGETELLRIWGKVETIRAKQAAKPKHSPLPEHVAPPSTQPSARVAAEEILRYMTAMEIVHASKYANGVTEHERARAAFDKFCGVITRHFPSVQPVEEQIVEAFRQTAIKAHIGFKHEGPWDTCEWVECEDRRNLIQSCHADATADNDHCTWTLDDSMDGDLWETGCGEMFQFNEGGPSDNKFIFCYKCGKRIDPGRYSDHAADSVGEEGQSKCTCCGTAKCDCGPFVAPNSRVIDDPCRICGKCIHHCPHQ